MKNKTNKKLFKRFKALIKNYHENNSEPVNANNEETRIKAYLIKAYLLVLDEFIEEDEDWHLLQEYLMRPKIKKVIYSTYKILESNTVK